MRRSVTKVIGCKKISLKREGSTIIGVQRTRFGNHPWDSILTFGSQHWDRYWFKLARLILLMEEKSKKVGNVAKKTRRK